MIQKFRRKGLKQLFDFGIEHGVNPQHVKRLRQILALLDTAETIQDMGIYRG